MIQVAHEIESRNGKSAMAYNSQRGLPWHGLGVALDGDATAEQMLVAADCNWTVEKYPVYVKRDTITLDGVTSQFVAVEGQYETMRSDDLKTLGVVGEVYEDFSNAQLLDFGQQILDQAREVTGLGARWDTMMSLRGGRVVVASLVIPNAFTVLGDDAHDLNLGVFTSHDGSMALGADIGTTRRVCMNTHQMAVAGAKTSVKIRHTTTMEERTKSAAKALGLAFDYSTAYAGVAEQMAAVEMAMSEVDQFLAELLPITAKTKGGVQRGEEIRDQVKANILNSTTISDDLRFTRYGVFNSTTEYVQHLREVRVDSRVDRAEQMYLTDQVGGTGFRLKERAYGLLVPA